VTRTTTLIGHAVLGWAICGGTITLALEYMDPEEVLEPSVFDPCHQARADSRRRRQAQIDHARQRLHAQVAQEPTTWCEVAEVVAVDRASVAKD
jgi:hypothetical protein